MGKGLYTQGVAVLLKRPVPIAELVPLLKGFKITGRSEGAESWQVSGPSLLLEYRPEVEGCITIDVVDRTWPDSMGESKEDKTLLEAWELGHFGPTCFPGSLQRACQHCYTWKEGAETAACHKAFLRIRFSYAAGARPDGPKLPRGYNAAQECEMMLGVVEALLEHRSALCYFNPNGEVLAPLASVTEIGDHYHKASTPPVGLLANRRMIKFDGTDWMMMDLVGMDQLDLVDLETCFVSDYDPNTVAAFLVNTALQIVKSGLAIKDGHTVTGPKDVLFQAKNFEDPLLAPPRDVLRFRPRDGTVSPPELGFGDKPLGKRNWWEFWKL